MRGVFAINDVRSGSVKRVAGAVARSRRDARWRIDGGRSAREAGRAVMPFRGWWRSVTLAMRCLTAGKIRYESADPMTRGSAWKYPMDMPTQTEPVRAGLPSNVASGIKSPAAVECNDRKDRSKLRRGPSALRSSSWRRRSGLDEEYGKPSCLQQLGSP
jgi:hypothetical protein